MTSSIDATARLAALMRAQVSTLRRRHPHAKTGKAAANRSPAGEEGPDVAGAAVQRMKALSRDDPQSAHAAVRIYLESVLLAEFGPQLANDPAFALMVDDVHEQLRSDPHLASALDQAAAILLGSTNS